MLGDTAYDSVNDYIMWQYIIYIASRHAVTSFIDEKSASNTEFANEDPIPRFTCNVTAQFHSQGHVMGDSQQ